eukprot:gnl/TRDRNA2_/TRDRNA2_57014_c0_seq1.p1 gnl/TRDRNA2_/TRDRNA2_57014_c0~~gnl/TRDRNA2_/TRDRNA2_57014_c0_seq1.p1  ORF type:complete len:262 (-),score=58.43 gnl/TRDRNA2_/TRDRNA2_57014_c0_seq1:109-894(-)
MSRTWQRSGTIQVLAGLLIGFCLGTLLLSTVRFGRFGLSEPTANMAIGTMGRSRAAVPQGAQMPRRSALRGLYDTASGTHLGHSGRYGSWNVHTRPGCGQCYAALVAYASSSESEQAMDRLKAALKTAEECVDDCAVEWDVVEELSATVDQSEKKGKKNSGILSMEELNALKSIYENIGKAEEEIASKPQIDEATVQRLKELEAATPFTVSKQVSSPEKAKRLDEALAEALEAARKCTDDCAVAWDTVEEISEAKQSLKDA